MVNSKNSKYENLSKREDGREKGTNNYRRKVSRASRQTGRRNPIATESDLRNAVNARNHRDDHRRLAAFASGRFSNFKAELRKRVYATRRPRNPGEREPFEDSVTVDPTRRGCSIHHPTEFFDQQCICILRCKTFALILSHSREKYFKIYVL